MNPGEIALEGYPEWYGVERDTEKTIKKLSNMRELGFYLANADEYIRRLAILRINELKLRDSIDTLKDIIDDPLENSINKELAAWTIKAVSLKWDIDLFIGNKTLNKYTGSEKYGDLYKVSVNDSLSSVKFAFPSAFINSELQLDNGNAHHSGDISFAISFSFKEWIIEWFHAWCSGFAPALKKNAAAFPSMLFNVLKRVISGLMKVLILTAACVFVKLPGMLAGTISKVYIKHKSRGKMQEKYGSYYGSAYSPRLEVSSVVKNAFLNMLYIIFFPVGLVLRNMRFVAGVLIVAYCFFTFTAPGRNTASGYLNPDLMTFQNKVYNTAKIALTSSWDELKDIFGIHERTFMDDLLQTQTDDRMYKKPGTAVRTDDNNQPGKEYRIISKKGLYLRKNPAETAEKVMDKPLAYGSTVTYLMKSQQDSAGKLWYYVRAAGDKTGWVCSKWVEETGGE